MRNCIPCLASLAAMLIVPTIARGDSPGSITPANAATVETSLSVVLSWPYPAFGPGFTPALKTLVEVSSHEDMSKPFVSVELPEGESSYRLAVAPTTTYYWRVTPFDRTAPIADQVVQARFTTAAPRNDTTTDDRIRYRNPRRGAHWTGMRPVEFENDEQLSPWFDRKAMLVAPMPTFAELKDRFPVPVFDGHPEAIDAYWYSWKTLLDVWCFAPDAIDHEAVANMIGFRAWGDWGSTMVFDSAFILHFARYGQQAYPFVTAFDNCYARQHENGFICRESDKNNREVYSGYPVNPPLFAWAEWEWYRLTGDKERLKRVIVPIVKHYEWFMTYQRRANGLYWTSGLQEADDSPRNSLMHYAASATSYQALAARHLAMMAKEIGRDDLAGFFAKEQDVLGKLVNDRFWDEEHGIYNDLDANEKFITELKPGTFCKHVHMFWPLIAGIAPPDRVERMLKELNDPRSFNRRNGVPSLSADSEGYTGGPNGDGVYWRGAVWPSGHLMVQEGLRVSGRERDWQKLAVKYFDAQLEVFGKEKTIKEYMAPDIVKGGGVPEFVGWGGIGPVANLIEAVLGFDIDAPANTITWRVDRLERHGLTNLKLNGATVELVCEPRTTASEPCQISITSSGEFTLKLIGAGETVEQKVLKGKQTVTVGKSH